MVVWAYKQIEELQGKTGFVNVADKELAQKLLKKGEVQNPQIGAANLLKIERGKPKAEKIVRRRKKKVEKVIEPETVETDEPTDND